MIITILSIGLLLLVFIQDLMDRKVYWFLFLMLFLVGNIELFSNNNMRFAVENLTINLFFILIISGIVYLYFKVVRRKNNSFLKNQIGLGDAFLFIAITPFLLTEEFILFFNLSLIFSLSISIPFLLRSRSFQIPLAGFQSLFLALVLILKLLDLNVLAHLINSYI
ncbi:MAG: hypothetical protein RH860_01790 [Cytophagales bacterium]